MEYIISLVQNFGFPVVVSLWFMLRLEKVISKNTDAVNSLILTLNRK